LRTLIVGDVHGCVDELDELAQRGAPDRIVLVGDLFTKGPDPVGVWRWVTAHGCRAVLGNHDDRLIAAIDGRRPDDRGAHRCVATLDAADPSWQAWVRAMPLWIEDVGGVTVVHACVHPTGSLDLTTRDMAINWRRWPNDAPSEPLWHQVYEGERRVAFGHDAVRGLVRVERHGRPWLMGLDTGCVYGRLLTGWIPETDEVLHVRARREYAPIGGRPKPIA
jgi:hypothetical protein